jgi:hypothetical protein
MYSRLSWFFTAMVPAKPREFMEIETLGFSILLTESVSRYTMSKKCRVITRL